VVSGVDWTNVLRCLVNRYASEITRSEPPRVVVSVPPALLTWAWDTIMSQQAEIARLTQLFEHFDR